MAILWVRRGRRPGHVIKDRAGTWEISRSPLKKCGWRRTPHDQKSRLDCVASTEVESEGEAQVEPLIEGNEVKRGSREVGASE